MEKNPTVKYASRYIAYTLLIIGVIGFFYGLISDKDLVFELSLILMIDGAFLLAEANLEKLLYDEKEPITVKIVLIWVLILGLLCAGLAGLIYGNLHGNLVLEYTGFLITLAGSVLVIIISSSD
jgi:hypothetical protein